jgi:AcrR family transcriptional regulator
MKADQVAVRASEGRHAVRAGRPPRALAGKVDERILDAAGKVFIERGFTGASVDEIAEAARAGKLTIYTRFPSKEALFNAVIERLARRNTGIDVVSSPGAPIEDRLEALATAILTRVLAPETMGLIRVAVAEAPRFPDAAASVSRMARDRQIDAISRILSEFTESDPTRALPAFAPDRLKAAAVRFLNLAVFPMVLRALFGDDLDALNAEIGPHVAESIAFFLTACEHREAAQ